MEKEIALIELDNISKQRNLWIFISLVLIVSNILLVFKLFMQNYRVVMVPGISSELVVSGDKVNRNYLEEVAMQYFDILLNLTPDTIEHKKKRIMKYISSTNKKYRKNIHDYFEEAKKIHSKYQLNTSFTTQDLKVDPVKMQVIAYGTLTSIYGKKVRSMDRPASYFASFELVAGHLRLKEFYELEKKEKKHAKKK